MSVPDAATETRGASARYEPCEAEAVRLSPAGRHFFFGYYDVSPWDASGRRLLAAEAAFADRVPTPGDALTLGLLDPAEPGAFVPFATTTAWGWQMGCRLQWLGDPAGDTVIYNQLDRDVSRYNSVAHELGSGQSRVVGDAVYSVAPDGTHAVSLDFDRLEHLRSGYGYRALPHDRVYDPAPKDAGVYHVDLNTGQRRLAVDLAMLAGLDARPDAAGATHWVNHLLMNPAGDRCVFLHRYRPVGGGWVHRLFSMRPDGSELRRLSPGYCVSHYGWRDPQTLIASVLDGQDWRFVLFDAERGRGETLGEDVLHTDGHCSFSPDGRWVLNDTYPDPDRRMQTLMLFEPATGRRIDLARFFALPNAEAATRCDLHPRWRRDGRAVCVDSSHEGFRGVYTLDVSHLIDE